MPYGNINISVTNLENRNYVGNEMFICLKRYGLIKGYFRRMNAFLFCLKLLGGQILRMEHIYFLIDIAFDINSLLIPCNVKARNFLFKFPVQKFNPWLTEYPSIKDQVRLVSPQYSVCTCL